MADGAEYLEGFDRAGIDELSLPEFPAGQAVPSGLPQVGDPNIAPPAQPRHQAFAAGQAVPGGLRQVRDPNIAPPAQQRHQAFAAGQRVPGGGPQVGNPNVAPPAQQRHRAFAAGQRAPGTEYGTFSGEEIQTRTRNVNDSEIYDVVVSESDAGAHLTLTKVTNTDPLVAEFRGGLIERIGAHIGMRTGYTNAECVRAERGEQGTMYIPFYVRLTKATESQNNFTFMINTNALVLEQDGIVFQINYCAVPTPELTAVKVQMATLITTASERMFGGTKQSRIAAQRAARLIISAEDWTPATPPGNNVFDATGEAIATALLQKAKEMVTIQADSGKVWRNKATVDAITRGALSIAAQYVKYIQP